MKIVYSLGLLMLFFNVQVFAQSIESVSIGINGLHCSACSFTVKKSLDKLDFVKATLVDLNERSAKVFLKEGKAISYHKLAKAIVHAGYSVRFVRLNFKEALPEDFTCWEDATHSFCVINSKDDTLLDKHRLLLVGKAFMPKKTYKKWSKQLDDLCTCSTTRPSYHALIQ